MNKKLSFFTVLLAMAVVMTISGCATILPGTFANDSRSTTAIKPYKGVITNTATGAQTSFIDDRYNGNGIVIRATESEIVVEYHDKDGIKISTNDGGFIMIGSGEVLIANLGFEDFGETATFTVPEGGVGPVVFRFKNPTTKNDPKFAVVNASLNDDKKRWYCPPWDGNRLYFAKEGVVDHITAFKVGGGLVSDVVDEVAPDGWIPTRTFYEGKTVNGQKISFGGGSLKKLTRQQLMGEK